MAGQSWSKATQESTSGTTAATHGNVSYAFPAATDGAYSVRLTLSSTTAQDMAVTIEGDVVDVSGLVGQKQIDRVATVTDDWLDVSLSAGGAVSLSDITVVPPAGAAVPGSSAWQRVYRQEFASLDDVLAFQSSPTVNSGLLPSDAANSPLQRPSLRSNVTVVGDRSAQDGQALGVFTRIGDYATLAGTATGWSNGRMMIRNQEHAPPVRIRTRLRLTASAFTKSAVMWWPAGGGWPWEVDFVETFGGRSTTDAWGSRQKITQRWHADLNGDGQAKEQLIKDIPLDATEYHVYDLFVTPERMWIEIDGVQRMETTDRRYIPSGPGFFSIGKAMTERRDMPGRTEDAVFVDWVEIYRPGRG